MRGWWLVLCLAAFCYALSVRRVAPACHPAPPAPLLLHPHPPLPACLPTPPHRRGGDPGAKVVADSGKPVTRENRLLSWAGEMEAQLVSQRQDLRRARMELASAQQVRHGWGWGGRVDG